MGTASQKIALLIPVLRLGGGAEKICSWVSRELEKGGQEVHVVTFVARENEHSIGGKRHVLNETYRGGILTSFSNAQKVKKLCAQLGITTLLSFTEEANAVAVLAKTCGGKFKVLLAVRNNPEVRGLLSRLFIKMGYRGADAVIANSHELAAILKDSFGLSRVLTIPNPSDIDGNEARALDSIPEHSTHAIAGKSVFLAIGRLIEQKGHIHLISAFAQVLKERPDSVLLIIGQGVLEDSLKSFVKERGVENRILFLGRLNNVYPYVKRADCFVLSSLFEGFPNVLFEALSFNKLVISTDCKTGPREILEAPLGEKLEYPYFAKYGVLTQPFIGSEARGAEDALAQLMVRAIAENFWKEKYAHGKERALQFRPDEIFAQWKGVLQI